MSFLNALASDGLSVGLRFYTAKMSRASEMGPAPVSQQEEEQELQTTRSAEAERLSKPAPPPPPKEQTPEEIAAGRAEANAMLSADGSLGLLQAAAKENQAEQDAEAAQTFTPGEEFANGASLNGELAAGEQLARSSAAAEPEESEESDEAKGNGEDGEENTDSAGNKELSEEEKKQVQEMKQRDQEVRTHEQAHMSAGGGLAGSASYEYETGPDGKKYAVGGEVPISTRGSSDPEQALKDAETVKRAAMAPAEPSSQDRSVAAQASADINKLRSEVADKRQEEATGGEGEGEQGGQVEGAQGAEIPGRKNAGGNNQAEADQAAMAGGMAQSMMNQMPTDQAGAAKPADKSSQGVKVDTVGVSTPQRLATNGDSFGSHVLSAYSAAKFAGNMSSYRPALASV
ncbi:hypothetical protein C4J81_08410 [Deltaproteobacteria bacterium Smac51]|nr:hypothetical protein C4J81_08410 [Deltaproteobacteria bacterium Smac51]